MDDDTSSHDSFGSDASDLSDVDMELLGELYYQVSEILLCKYPHQPKFCAKWETRVTRLIVMILDDADLATITNNVQALVRMTERCLQSLLTNPAMGSLICMSSLPQNLKRSFKSP